MAIYVTARTVTEETVKPPETWIMTFNLMVATGEPIRLTANKIQ